MSAATIQRIIIPLITKLKLNTWDPYKIKYPIPFLETSNSPIIIPTNVKDRLIFNELVIVFIFDGSISFVNI